MKPKALLKILFTLSFIAFWCTSARAVVITFTAEIDNRYGGSQYAVIEALLPAGTVVTGRIRYDLGAEVINVLSPDTGSGNSAVTYRGSGFSIEAGEFRASAVSHEVTVGNGAFTGIDQFNNWADVDDNVISSGTPIPVYSMGLGLYEETGTLFSSVSLPDTNLSLADFDSSSFTLSFARDLSSPNVDTGAAFGRVSSLLFTDITPVPAPGTLVLLSLGLLGVALCHSKRGHSIIDDHSI